MIQLKTQSNSTLPAFLTYSLFRAEVVNKKLSINNNLKLFHNYFISNIRI